MMEVSDRELNPRSHPSFRACQRGVRGGGGMCQDKTGSAPPELLHISLQQRARREMEGGSCTLHATGLTGWLRVQPFASAEMGYHELCITCRMWISIKVEISVSDDQIISSHSCFINIAYLFLLKVESNKDETGSL